MDLLTRFLELFLNLDDVLASVIETYGAWTYTLLFAVVFAETGLVVTPFLPGDSLLFAAGTFAGRGSLNVTVVSIVLWLAAVLGDTANYWVGKSLGTRITRSSRRWIKPKHLERTHEFFTRYGAKTIVLARFVPVVRTFAPFVAGIGTMEYRTFLIYNVVGGALWVAVCVGGGYWFGGLPIVQENFGLVVVAIVVVSVLPAVVEYLRARRSGSRPDRPLTPGSGMTRSAAQVPPDQGLG
jgi:membrane-associated protein